MKKNKLLIMLFSMGIFTHTVYAQNDTVRNGHKYVHVIYDFTNPNAPDSIWQTGSKVRNVEKVWFGKRIFFQVKINPYLYDLLINSTQVLDDGPDDSEGLSVFTKNVESFNKGIDAANKADVSVSAAPEPKTTATSTVSEVTKLAKADANADETPLGDAANSLYSFTVKKENKDFIKLNNDSTIDNLKTTNEYFISSTKNKTDNLIDLSKSYLEIRDKVVTIYKSRRELFQDAIDSFYSRINNLNDFKSGCQQALLSILSNDLSAKDIISNTEKLIKPYHYADIEDFIINGTYDANNNLLKVKKAYSTLTNVFNNLKDLNDSIGCVDCTTFNRDSSLFTSLTTAYNLLVSADPSVITNALGGIFSNLKNNGDKAFLHSYHTQKITGDTVKFNISVKPSAQFDSLIHLNHINVNRYDTAFTYPVTVKGDFKLNFSVGAAFQFGKLRPSTYFFDSAYNAEGALMHDTLIIKQNSINNRFRPLLSAYAHAYVNLKILNYFTPALTIGLSTNPTQLSDASFMLGGSFIFGAQNRFIATIGFAGASVDYLKGKYQTGMLYATNRFNNINETDLVEKTFRTGFFFGFSYNISINR